jgi:hypothetical protein
MFPNQFIVAYDFLGVYVGIGRGRRVNIEGILKGYT